MRFAGGRRGMTATPFESVESAQEYMALLCDAVEETMATVEEEIVRRSPETDRRELDALRLVDYKLKTLAQHLVASRRLLNDLRTLRRYLLDERTPVRSDREPHTHLAAVNA
jgi:hypothetical protein